MPLKEPPPLYGVWASMRQRCTNQSAKSWPSYGGRGISVCERWNNFANFVSDMGDRPDGYSLDRIDNDKGYSPDNCRWADKKTQQRNRTVRCNVVIDGVTYRAIILAEQAGVKTDTIVERARRGLPLEEVLSPTKLKPDYAALIPIVVARATATKRAKSECKSGHPFNEGNTYTTKQGWRRCRVCRNAKLAQERSAGV